MRMTKFDRHDHYTYPCLSTELHPARSYYGANVSCILDGEGYCQLHVYNMPYSYRCRKPYFEMLAILEALDPKHVSIQWLRENGFEAGYSYPLVRRSFIDGKIEERN